MSDKNKVYIFVGELDNWTPASACEQLVSELKNSKDNIDITNIVKI